MKRAVITGPTGVVGMALINNLIKKNIEIYVVCRPDSKRMSQIPKHPLLNIVLCDLKNILKLPELINVSCDAFYHLAWLGTDNPDNRFNMYIQSDNIRYSIDAVRVAKILGCKVFIGAGSQAEYGHIQGIIHPYMSTNPVSGYGASKLCASQMTRIMCNEMGIKHIWTRIVSLYGPYDNKNTFVSYVIEMLLKDKKPSLTKCEQVWDYLYSEDAAEALFRMAESGKDGSIYVLGSGTTKKLRDYAEIIRDIINPDLSLGFGEKKYYKDQAMHLEADISNLVRDTGWKPCTDFKDGIKKICKI